MTHSAKIIADSLSPDGVRLTSIECRYPRIIHGEVMTHRVFSRNAASSRAIPIEKMIRDVQDDPYIPTHWGKNQKGMVADTELDENSKNKARYAWLEAKLQAVDAAMNLRDIGVHKQIVNRLLEPFQWYTCLITATEWDNFIHLRSAPDAHPEIRALAVAISEALGTSQPRIVGCGEWHLPYGGNISSIEIAKKVSIGRCARLSYLTHDGQHSWEADVALHDRLLASGHLSPFEHVATPLPQYNLKLLDGRKAEWEAAKKQRDQWAGGHASTAPETSFVGNFRGWVQARKLIPNEADIKKSDYPESE